MKNKKNSSKKEKKEVITTTVTTTTTTTTVEKVLPKETHYLLILDESGSMESVRKQTLDGLNEQIQSIKKLDKKYPEQKFFISIVKFDDEIKDLILDTPISNVREFTMEDYKPDASTALRDAVGVSVTRLKSRIESKTSSGEACAVVVILTDGQENCSKEYTPSAIKDMITELSATESWIFSFIGANQDSITTAGSYGIHTSNTVNYTASGAGTRMAFASVSAGLDNIAFRNTSTYYAGNRSENFMSEVVNGKTDLGEDTSILDNFKTPEDDKK